MFINREDEFYAYMEDYKHQHLSNISTLARRWRTNSNTHTIDLSHNALTDEGALQLASVLCVNHHLTALNLAHNRITDQGLGYLVRALQHKTTLRILHIGGNLDCTTRHVPALLKTDLSHLLYEGTYIMEVDEDLRAKWPPVSFDEIVYRCHPPAPPGQFTCVTDPHWRKTCQVAYDACNGHDHWTFFRTMVPPCSLYLDWPQNDENYLAWHAVHETLSLSLVHHHVSPEQYEQLLRMLQCVARKGWDFYCRNSTCKMVE